MTFITINFEESDYFLVMVAIYLKAGHITINMATLKM